MRNFGLAPQLVAACQSGAHILAPNNRVAHSLRLRYAHHAQESGLRAWRTPGILTFNSFALELWQRHAAAAERVLSVEQTRLLWTRIVAGSSWADHLLSPSATASSAFRAWEGLQAWQITREDLAAHCVAEDNAEARALLAWGDQLAVLCLERRWLPVHWIPRRLEAQPIECVDLQILTLSELLTPTQTSLLDYLVAHGATWNKFGDEASSGTTQVRGFESVLIEMQAAALWARDRLTAGKRSIGIVVPDLAQAAATMQRALTEMFAQSDRTVTGPEVEALGSTFFSIAGHRSLRDFPVVDTALDVLRLAAGRIDRSGAGRLLRSPFLRGGLGEASPRALCDLRLRAQSRERFDLVSLGQLATVAACPALTQCCTQALALKVEMSARATPSEQVTQFVSLWRAFGWPGDRTPNGNEQQAIGRFQQALAEFGALDELMEPAAFTKAISEFEQLLRDIRFEPRSAPASIMVIDSDSAEGMRFDAVWITTMDGMHWPPPATPDPFIPLVLQVKHGMRGATAQGAREKAWRRFELLRVMAPEVVFSWARQVLDAEVMPSPWLGVGVSDTEGSQEVGLVYAERIFAARPTLESIVETGGPPLTAIARGGARIFELQSQCPFRAFVELRLGAQPLEEINSNVTAKERGVLVHSVLADVWQTLGGTVGLTSRSPEQIETLVRTSLSRHAAKFLQGASAHRARMLQIEQDLAAERILELLRIDATRASFRVLGRPEQRETVTVGSLSFELQLDRMDAVLNMGRGERRIIVDYKTGSVKSSWFSDRPEQPQLPLYAVTHLEDLAAVSFALLGAKGVRYEGVARDSDLLPGVDALAEESSSPGGWPELLSHWQTVIERLADEYGQGRAEVDPLPNACRYCHLKSVCRVSAIGRARALTREMAGEVDEGEA